MAKGQKIIEENRKVNKNKGTKVEEGGLTGRSRMCLHQAKNRWCHEQNMKIMKITKDV